LPRDITSMNIVVQLHSAGSFRIQVDVGVHRPASDGPQKKVSGAADRLQSILLHLRAWPAYPAYPSKEEQLVSTICERLW
jgi:hypothetical protein